MNKPNDAIDLTVVYDEAGAGRLTAIIPALPGTISLGRNQAEASSNGVDALRTMLSVEPEKVPDGARAERVRVTLGIARSQTRDLGLDLAPGSDGLVPVMAASALDSAGRAPSRFGPGNRVRGYVPFSVPQPPQTPV